MGKLNLGLAAVFLAVLASGCTSGPSTSDIQSQVDETRGEVMEQVEQNSISIDISAVYKSEQESVVQIRNTGTKTLSSRNLTVETGLQSSGCQQVGDIPAGNNFDCRTSIDFPDTGETAVYEVITSETVLDTYNCTLENSESIAC